MSQILQHDPTDCGAACLVSVAAHYGYFVSVANVRQWAGTSIHGTSILGLMHAADKMGMETKALRMSAHGLPKIRYPAIAHVQLRNGLAHYVVVFKVAGDCLLVMDPAYGKFSWLAITGFSEIWTGAMLTIRPGGGFKKNRKSTVLTKILDAVHHQRKRLLLACIAGIFYSLLSLAISFYLKMVMDDVLETRNVHVLVSISVVMILLLVVQLITGILKQTLSLNTSQAIDRKLILGYYDHLLRLPQRFYDSMQIGELVSRINDAGRINAFINETAINLFVDGLIILFSLLVMFVYNWRLALIMLTIVPVYGLLIYAADVVNRKWQRKIMETSADLHSQVVQSLHASSTIKKMTYEDSIARVTRSKFENLLLLIHSSSIRLIYIHSGADFITKFFTLLVIWIGCHLVFSNDLTKGELVAFFAMLSYFTAPVMSLLGAGKNIRDTMIAAERLFEISDLEKEASGTLSLPLHAVTVEFRDVSFGYLPNQAILKKFSLVISNNRITGISGPSGCGKSTLVALLLRLYDPDEGQIIVNGKDLKEINVRQLRSMIACVPQMIDLFTFSIVENITLDQPLDEKYLDEVVERSGVYEFCSTFPDGLNTIVTENASNLSAGQKQKIGLARALYRRAPILVLDEFTASVDRKSENKLVQTIEWYKNKGNTIIIISHGDTPLKICDNIVFLTPGTGQNINPPL